MADQAAGSVVPCSVISTVTFRTKGKANVAPALDAPLTVTVTNRFCPLSRAAKAAAEMHVVDAKPSWEPETAWLFMRGRAAGQDCKICFTGITPTYRIGNIS